MWRSTEVLQESVELVWAGYMGLSGYIDFYMGHICGCVGVILLYGACKGWQLFIRAIYNYGVNRLLSKSTFKKHILLRDGIASAFFVEWMATRMWPSQKRSADFDMTCCFWIPYSDIVTFLQVLIASNFSQKDESKGLTLSEWTILRYSMFQWDREGRWTIKYGKVWALMKPVY